MTLAKKQRAEDVELLKRLQASEHAKYEEWCQMLRTKNRQERITNKSRDKVTESVEKFVSFKNDALRGLPSRFENMVDAQVSEDEEEVLEGEEGDSDVVDSEDDNRGPVRPGPVSDSEEDDVARGARDGN